MTMVGHSPLHRWAPDSVESLGDIAAKVGVDLGLVPDAEQRWLLDRIYDETVPGIPTSYEVCVVAPRQNLKSATLEIAALTDLFVFGVELAVWTAHEFKTARKSFEDMRKRIRRHPDYAARAEFRDSHGEEAIFLDTGERLEFHARSGGSGRGFTCGKLTLDEAMYLQDGDLGALVPTMFTIPDAQVRYGSSAGKRRSAALRSLRTRGREGGDQSLAYVEYGAETRDCARTDCTHALGSLGCALDDRELWWQANCALWAGRATEDAVERQRKALPPAEFAREFLSWWEDPPEDEAGVFGEAWPLLLDESVTQGSSPVFAVATNPERTWSAISTAFRRPDGLVQVLLVDYRPGAMWVEARVKELQARHGGKCAADTAARGLVQGAEEPSEASQTQAHNLFADAVDAKTLRHGGEPAMTTSVRTARWRPQGNSRVLDRKGEAEISPLIAAALAFHSLTSRSAGGWMVSL